MRSKTYSIIFDLDGVLLDSETDMSWMKKAIEDTLQYFNIKINDEIVSKLDHKNISRFPDIAKELQIDSHKLWENRNKFYTKRKIEAMTSNQIQPFKDISAITQLTPFSELAILSNSPQEVVDIFLNHFQYDHLFSAAVGRTDKYEDIFKLKPHPLLWEKMKPLLTGEKLFYVGDRISDQIFAENMNMGFYGLNRYNNEFEHGYDTLDDIVKDIIKNISKDKN